MFTLNVFIVTRVVLFIFSCSIYFCLTNTQQQDIIHLDTNGLISAALNPLMLLHLGVPAA